MKKSVVIAAAAFALAGAQAHAAVVSDCCDWSSGWTFSSYGFGVGTATATVEGSGGNPGARLNITTHTPGAPDTAFGTAVLDSVSTPAPTSGAAFTLTLDVLSGAGAFGQGQGIQLLVEQGGSVYAMGVGITGFPLSSFTTLNFNGNFNAGSFAKISGGGPATPSFDGSTTTSYGFAAGNNQSGDLTQYYDNFQLTFNSGAPPASIVPVPAVSPWTLPFLGLLIAAVVFLRRRPS